MSKTVNRIEKEFFLKLLFDEQLPLTYRRDRAEYTLFLASPPKERLALKPDRPIERLPAGSSMNLTFSHNGVPMLFDVEVTGMNYSEIICSIPANILKNLDRTNMRVTLPPEVCVHVSFLEDRYGLAPLPRLRQYHPVRDDFHAPAAAKERVDALVSEGACSVKMELFGGSGLSATEEKVLAYTGKTIFLQNVANGFPQKDYFGQNRLVTADVFSRYLLEDLGIEGRAAEAFTSGFFKEKTRSGVTSDAWVPILFQEYTVGCLRAWVSGDARPPVSHTALDALTRYAEVMALVLKKKGAFAESKLANEPFRATVHDISTSGMLFTCPDPELALKFMPKCDLKVTLSTLRRNVDIKATVIRKYRDRSSATYIGCQFKGMEAEDTKFLFECIYAKPFEGAALP